MEEKYSMQNSADNLHTPLYKIFFLISLFTLSVFGSFYLLVKNRNQELKTAYSTIEQGQKSFSTLIGYHQVVGMNSKRHIYTYLVTDEFGKIHEISEFVDDKSHLRLRVGNTIVTRQKKVYLAGKQKIISRIEGNNQILPNYDYLEEIALIGNGFAVLVGFVSFVLFLFRRNLP